MRISVKEMFMNNYRKALLLLAIFVFSFGACQDKDHEHGEGAAPHDDHGDDSHGAAHAPHMESQTSWGARTQVLIEHEPWMASTPSAMTVHVTRLDGYQPMSGLTLLTSWQQAELPVVQGMPANEEISPGVYVVPVPALIKGGHRLEIVLQDGMGEVDVHSMTNVRVYMKGEHGEHVEDAEISLGLEAQWRMPFGVKQALKRRIRPHIAAFAHLTLPSYKEAVITAPRDGRVLAPAASIEAPRVGQEVRVGEVVLEMTTSSVASADPAALDLAVEQASLRLGAAQKEVDRVEPLVERGVVASKRLTTARLERDVARAALRSARRQRESLSGSQKLDRRRDAITLPSPIAGRLAEVNVAPGAWVKQGDHLASVVDDGELWLDVDVPEAYVQRLKALSGVWFDVGDGEVIELGKESLISVGPTLHRGRRTLPVRFRVKRQDDARLFAGMTMRARVMTDEARSVVTVPSKSVMIQDGQQVVYVQTGAERFERRQVRTGVRDGEWVEVEQGVEYGEWVVSEGVYAVRLASAASSDEIGHGHAH
jgi:cobalt-zinc-cadmium efflux system membrane fusion protein